MPVGVWLIHAHQRAPSGVHHHVNASPCQAAQWQWPFMGPFIEVWSSHVISGQVGAGPAALAAWGRLPRACCRRSCQCTRLGPCRRPKAPQCQWVRHAAASLRLRPSGSESGPGGPGRSPQESDSAATMPVTEADSGAAARWHCQWQASLSAQSRWSPGGPRGGRAAAGAPVHTPLCVSRWRHSTYQ